MQRITYIDAMRGLAMISVVVYHCINISNGENPIIDYVNRKLELPLFFLISGFFANKIRKRTALVDLKNKFIALVVPAAIMLGIYTYLNDINYLAALQKLHKDGYWFTFILFEFFVIYTLIDKTASALRLSSRNIALVHIASAIASLYLFSFLNARMASAPVFFDAIGLFHMQQYIFFVAGSILFEYKDQITQKLTNNKIALITGGGAYF